MIKQIEYFLPKIFSTYEIFSLSMFSVFNPKGTHLVLNHALLNYFLIHAVIDVAFNLLIGVFGRFKNV